MDIKDIFIPNVLVPNKLIFKNKIHKILDLDKKFVVKGYTIKIVNEKIDMIYIKNPHPNANPRTGEFCIPDNLREYELDNKIKKLIEIMICCFNLDDCYFTPWNEIKYENKRWEHEK